MQKWVRPDWWDGGNWVKGLRREGEVGGWGCYYKRWLSFVIKYSNIYLITCQLNPIESIQPNLHKYTFLSNMASFCRGGWNHSQTFSIVEDYLRCLLSLIDPNPSVSDDYHLKYAIRKGSNLIWVETRVRPTNCRGVKEFFCSSQFGFSSPFGVMFQHLLFVFNKTGKTNKINRWK